MREKVILILACNFISYIKNQAITKLKSSGYPFTVSYKIKYKWDKKSQNLQYIYRIYEKGGKNQ